MNSINARAPISAARPMPSIGAVPKSFLLLIMAWLFDFPAESAGEGLSTQQYFAGIYIVSTLLFVIGDRDDGRRVPGLMLTMVLGALYLVIGIAVGLAENQPTYSVLRNGLTVFVYLTAIYTTARVALMSDPARLRWFLGIACLLYALANLLIDYLGAGGIDLASVRYQIVGVSVNAALAYITLALLFRLSRTEWITMLANGVI
ncbi:MAG TPA: hypothetical protein VFV30_03660, partial [Novosphingobium sp.]|nr:hypothetical protein [Novosphingobium sp.]